MAVSLCTCIVLLTSHTTCYLYLTPQEHCAFSTGYGLVDKWTEADWVRSVPLHLRRDRQECGPVDGQQLRRSYSVYQQLLIAGKPTEWLDHAVLYVASAEFNVGVFVIYDAGYAPASWYCARIGANKQRHVVLYHQRGHYECVEYDGLREFPSEHELVQRLTGFAAAHPQQLPEDDVELQAVEAREEEERARAAAVQSQPMSPAVATTPVHTQTQPAKRTLSTRAGKAKAKRALSFGDVVGMQHDEPDVHSDTSGRVKQLPPLLAQVATHGPVYERVSFHNHAQWRAANEPLWNAYRLASITGQRGQLTAILLDILLLPRRILPKLGRSGRAARRRAVAGIGRRLRSEAERLRERYNCPDPSSKEQQRTEMTTETMANSIAFIGETRPRRAASIAAREVIRQQVADTTDAESSADSDGEAEVAASDSDDERDDAFPSLSGRTSGQRADPDSRAARRADSLVQSGLTRKAAQVLHSTAQMADLRTAEAQEAMLRLHPRQPSTAVLPVIPESAPLVLEDDADMRRLLTQSDNGTAAGPSGWCGNMLAILAQSDVCRLGFVALLRDIINGELPDEARQLLLTSRLVALAKPNSDSLRPIAVGELFYRLAAIVAVRRVMSEAAGLLAPHQYGVGVPAGAERIVHTLQHELTDADKRLALLQLDMANAFNSCDRARLLRELYALPELQSVHRVADFAYSQPSTLVLSGCDGLMIESEQGVRQGDPLSALLFCVYMKHLLEQVSAETGVRVYGFFDDINLLGSPQQLMAALSHLQSVLPAASLQLNTAKSHFTYFHDHLTPLSTAVRGTLSTHNIECHHTWVGVVGAVVGRDDAAIREGMHSVLTGAGSHHDAFLRRIRLDEMPIQTAMLLLRQCLVPALNYHLRCIAPGCIDDEARQFDQRMLEAAMDKLGLTEEERRERTTTLLQRKLRDGGWGLISAARTSPAAFLGSLAACHTEPVFSTYGGDAALPYASQLHRWVDDSLQRVRQAAPGDQYQADIEPILPVTAGDFFRFYSTADPSGTAKLQRSLNAKATQSNTQAAVESAKLHSKQGDKWEWAHQKAITAKGAWGWKIVQPEGPHLRLSDVEYAIAARLNLGLQPFSARAMAALPGHCPLCTHRHTRAPISFCDDPWHSLTCTNLIKGELSRRHDAVVDAIGRVAWMVGAQVKREVEELDADSRKRPDLEIVFPGRRLLTDVVVSHSLTASSIVRGQCLTTQWQGVKNKKYAGVAARIGAELLNVSLDSCGGMAADAVSLVAAIAEEGEKWSMGTWNSGEIKRQLLGAMAVAVQRGNALAMLVGYTRSGRGSALSGRVNERGGKEAEGASGVW